MSKEDSRRELQFANFQQVRDEVQRLKENGYVQSGAWDLGQICQHLDCWMTYPMDGFPKASFPVNLMLRVAKVMVGKRMLHKVVTEKKMKPGGPTMSQTRFEPPQDEDSVVDAFAETTSRFETYSGKIHASPVFGEMDYETATKLQLVHCAHHLSFLIPRQAKESG